jgi:hypothetical protein
MLCPGATNLALGASTAQSSDYFPSSGSPVAVDGDTNGSVYGGSLTHTQLEVAPWWQVDLGGPRSICQIKIWNRTDCCGERLNNFYVFVSDVPFVSTDPTTTAAQGGVSTYYQSIPAGQAPAMYAISIGRVGRHVRIQLAQADYLSLAEVQVLGDTTTPGLSVLSAGQPATQSSQYGDAAASRAVDGNRDGVFWAGSVTHTQLDNAAWWQVDLGAVYAISLINLYNRSDCCSDRLKDFRVFVSESPFTSTDPLQTASQPGVATFLLGTGPDPAPSMYSVAIGRLGRYVRVQLNGANYLSLAEVDVLGRAQAANVAVGMATAQSSTYAGAAADRAVDGNTNGNYYGTSVSHTDYEAHPWWMVDLGSVKSLTQIQVYNRTDCCGARLDNFYVFVSDVPFASTDPYATASQVGVGAFYHTSGGAPAPLYTVDVNRTGRYIRVQLTSANYLALAEVRVLGLSP